MPHASVEIWFMTAGPFQEDYGSCIFVAELQIV